MNENINTVPAPANPNPTATKPTPVVITGIPNEGITVSRNDKSLRFVVEKLKKRGNGPERVALVPAPDATEEDRQTFLEWVGSEQLYHFGRRATRQMAVILTDAAISDSGVFSSADFVKGMAEFSARGETLKALFTERESLIKEMTEVSMSDKLTPENRNKRIKEIGSRMLAITEAIEAKKEANREDDED